MSEQRQRKTKRIVSVIKCSCEYRRRVMESAWKAPGSNAESELRSIHCSAPRLLLKIPIQLGT